MKSKGARTPATAAQLASLLAAWPRARNDDPARMTLDETREALVRALSHPTSGRRYAARRREQ